MKSTGAMGIVTSAARCVKSSRFVQIAGLLMPRIMLMGSAINVARNAIVTNTVINAVTLIATTGCVISAATYAIIKCAVSNLATNIAMSMSNTTNTPTKPKSDVRS